MVSCVVHNIGDNGKQIVYIYAAVFIGIGGQKVVAVQKGVIGKTGLHCYIGVGADAVKTGGKITLCFCGKCRDAW